MQVYADNAATTAMSRTAIDAMLPYLDNIYGNPSSLHSVGQRAKEALIKSARAVSERFFGQSRYRKRRNTLCIFRFRYRRVDGKDSLTAADDLFRGSQI